MFRRQNWVVALLLVILTGIILSYALSAVNGTMGQVDVLSVLRRIAEPGFSLFGG